MILFCNKTFKNCYFCFKENKFYHSNDVIRTVYMYVITLRFSYLGYEIPICKKQSCLTAHDKHYHCPQCETVCQERSLTVNHLWRCLQRSSDQKDETDQLSDEDDEDMINTVDESQLNVSKIQTSFRLFKSLQYCGFI